MRERKVTAAARGEPRTTEFPAGRVGVRLVEIAGEKLGASHPIRDELILGRVPEDGVAIASPGVSRRHARIARRGDETFVIEDLGSRNGTLVNGVPIDGVHPIHVGDRIQLGADVVFLFTRDDPVDEHLSHLRRMEVVGRLTASVVHDFNNLLAVMLASLEHLDGLELDSVIPDVEAEASVEDALTAGRDAAALTRRLLTVARPAGTGRNPVALATVVDEVIRMCRRMFGDRVTVSHDTPRQLRVLGDETEFAQVLMNLCVNARDAMPDGGTLKLTAAVLDLTRHAPPVPLTADYAVLTVEDDGVGMDATVVERIFDPFFTTKGEGRGSGLGLATVYTSVRRMGGHVEVDSAPGRGTKFTLYLPLATRRPLAETTAVARRLPVIGAGGAFRPLEVLLAADDDLSRRATRRLIRRAGHEPRTFDREQAAEVLATKSVTPDLVVIDPDSGDGDPRERIAGLVKAAGDVPVVILAAYLSPEAETAAREAGAVLVLRKPVGAKDLGRAFLAALAGV